MCSLYQYVEETINKWCSPDEELCDHSEVKKRETCNSMVLGSLLRSATAKHIYPVPQPPYGTISFDSLSKIISTLDIASLCQNREYYVLTRRPSEKSDGILDSFRAKSSNLKRGMRGLDIEDFRGTKKARMS